MAALAYSAIRQRVAAGLDAISGWTEGKYPYDVFGRDASTLAHLGFAVGLPESEWTDDRQKLSRGTRTRTTVGVRFTARIKPKDQVASYDTALDAEQDAIEAVMGVSYTDLHLRLTDRATREVIEPGEWILVNLIFEAAHRIALS